MSSSIQPIDHEPTLVEAVVQEQRDLKNLIRNQLDAHVELERNRVREETQNPEANPPIPWQMLKDFVKMYQEALKVEADLLIRSQPTEPRTQVANFFFDVNSYSKFKQSLTPSARAELARLEQEQLRQQSVQTS